MRGAYRVDEATVADLTEIAERYQRIYHTIPAEELLAGVLQHLRMVSRFLKTTQPTDLHRGLALAAGETAVVAGWLSFYDLNDRTDALVYYSIAAKAAREAGNHGLATYALGQMSFLPAYAGKAKDALLFVDRAAHEAAYGVSAKTSGWLAATQAEAEAKLGDRPASLRSLDRAERALAAAGDQEHPPWIEYFDQSRLAGHKGACYTWLGEAEQACQALDEALGHLGPSAPKRRSVVLADKAAALIERKELDEGCRVAGQALTILADTPYAAGFQRVRDVWARVQPQRETPAARELEAQILATALGR